MRPGRAAAAATLLFCAAALASCGGDSTSSGSSPNSTAPADTSSPGSTSTASATSTIGTPAPSPQVTAGAPPVQLEVLDFRHYVVDDWLYYIGQVQNTGSTDVTDISIDLKLVGSDSEVYTANDALKALSVLPAGETMPFKLVFQEQPPSPGPEIFTATAIPVDARTARDYRDFLVSGVTVSSQGNASNPQSFVLQGQVTNQGTQDVTTVRVTFVGYDAAGHVTAAWNGQGPAGGLKAGASGPFVFAVLDPQGTPSNYAMIVTGK